MEVKVGNLKELFVPDNIGTNKTNSTNTTMKEESIFTNGKNEISTSAILAVSIPGAIVLGIAGAKILPKIIKALKNTQAAASVEKSLQKTAEETALSKKALSKAASISKLSEAEKKAELERLTKLINDEKAKFIKENESKFIEFDENNPLSLKAFEERVKEIIPYVRGAYGQSSLHLDTTAKCIAFSKERYLGRLWSETPMAKELLLQLELTKLSPEEIAVFSNAVKVLKAKNIKFNPYELLKDDFGKGIMNSLGKYGDKFAVENYVVGSDYAYRVNGLLRRGIEPDDIIVKVLDQGFKDVNPFGVSRTVYRSVMGGTADKSADFIKQLVQAKKGDTFIDRAYSYTTFRRGAACPCNAISDVELPEIVLTIDIPKGSRVSMNTAAAQVEALFPRNSVFKVVEPAHQTIPGVEFVSGDGIPMKSGGTMEMMVKFVGTEENQRGSSGFLSKIKSFLHI